MKKNKHTMKVGLTGIKRRYARLAILLSLAPVLASGVVSCGGTEENTGNAEKIAELTRRIEVQNKEMEQSRGEIEALRDSITVLQGSMERIRSHSIHAITDVRQAKGWANAHGYSNTLVPSIDNVLYDLEAIKGYTDGAVSSE